MKKKYSTTALMAIVAMVLMVSGCTVPGIPVIPGATPITDVPLWVNISNPMFAETMMYYKGPAPANTIVHEWNMSVVYEDENSYPKPSAPSYCAGQYYATVISDQPFTFEIFRKNPLNPEGTISKCFHTSDFPGALTPEPNGMYLIEDVTWRTICGKNYHDVCGTMPFYLRVYTIARDQYGTLGRTNEDANIEAWIIQGPCVGV